MRSVVKYLFDCTICPPRAKYDPDNTVSAITSRDNAVYERHNVEFTSDTNLKLMGSLWTMQTKSSTIKPSACLIYLHSLGTNQFEALNIVPLICSPVVSVFAFDFPGCGVSEGTGIPLDGSGYKLVLAAQAHLRTHFQIREFALWGRSMGAAIALHTVSFTNEFNCVVADSSFETTKRIVIDQARANHIPQFLIKMAFPIFRNYAREFAEIDIDSPFPIEYVSSARTPLMMGHGRNDTFVPPHHARHLFDKYGCKAKQLYLFAGKHNSTRPSHWYEAAGRFIYRHFGISGWVKSYNSIYASSGLHVGELQVVLEDLAKLHLSVEKQSHQDHVEEESVKEEEESSSEEPYNELQTFTDVKNVVYP